MDQWVNVLCWHHRPYYLRSCEFQFWTALLKIVLVMRYGMDVQTMSNGINLLSMFCGLRKFTWNMDPVCDSNRTTYTYAHKAVRPPVKQYSCNIPPFPAFPHCDNEQTGTVDLKWEIRRLGAIRFKKYPDCANLEFNGRRWIYFQSIDMA